MRTGSRSWVAWSVIVLSGCGGEEQSPSPADDPMGAEAAGFQAVSFLGDTLRASPDPAAVEVQEPLLDDARAALASDSTVAENWIWVGRRLGYLQQYREAIDQFTAGAERFPEDPRFLRHRGHRYLSVRETANAIRDLERAGDMVTDTEDRVEPDGLPNERGIPTSTLHFNIWYHLGLGHFLEGDYEAALAAYERCLSVSGNPDALVATSYWMYMTLMRLGRDADAQELLEPVNEDMDIIENGSYRDLLLLFKGAREPEDVVPEGGASLAGATTLFGVANWHRFQGREAEADDVLDQLLAMRSQWPSFGYIAAEADVARR